MKAVIISILFAAFFGFSALYAQEARDTIVIDAAKDSTEYQLIIIDPGFESWLVTQPPISFHSKQYYRTWNLRYVNEWNNLYRSGRYPQYVESYVDYDPNADYDIELNYKLYWYFRYFEKKYGITLVQRGGRLS
ncbi:MAG: DUF6146 family protein [Marinilabiliaceae bacterium]|jgi:hypothetical protein|nr:DUF6146 family protein [Marinilabiliaceae bacterium]